MLINRWLARQFRSQPAALWVLVTVSLMMWLGLGATLPIRTIYAEREGASLTEIGLMGAAFLLTQFIFQLPFGRLNDRWGRRPFILFAVILHVGLSVAYLFLNSAGWFIAVRALEGIGTAAFTPAARAYISDVVSPLKRGEAFGLFGASVSGGLLLGPAAGGFIGAAFGFTMPFIFCSATGLLAVLLVVCVLPESQQPKLTTIKNQVARPSRSLGINVFGLYFLAAYIIMFTLQFVMSLLGTVWNIWLNDQGDSLNQIGLTYTVYGLPALFFTPYFGRLIDRSQRRAYFYMAGGIGIASIYASYGFVTGHFGLIIALGLVESLAFALVQPITDRYTAEIIPATARGTGQALFSTFSTLGGFAGAMLTTWVYQFWVGAPFLMAGGVQLVSTLIGGTIMWRYERRHRLQPALSEPLAISG